MMGAAGKFCIDSMAATRLDGARSRNVHGLIARSAFEESALSESVSSSRLSTSLSGMSTVVLREVDVCVPCVAIWLAAWSKRSGSSPELVRRRWDARQPDSLG